MVMYRTLCLQNKTKELAINIFDSYLIHAASLSAANLAAHLKNFDQKSRNMGNSSSNLPSGHCSVFRTRRFGDDISNFSLTNGKSQINVMHY